MARKKGSKNKEKKVDYKATLRIYGQNFEAKGNSVLEAIQNLTIPNAKGLSILTLEHGEKKQEKVLPLVQTMRVFHPSPSIREVNVKRISMLFEV